ncbi:MAG: hypothetical protein ACREJL_01130 [Candidatus Methylomirabilales bacterium]
MDRLPFAPYDFFGYLASGFLVIIAMDLTLGFPRLLGFDLGIVESIALVLAAYIAGQIIATPSKAVLEDGLVGKLLRRPSVNLFQEGRPRVRGLLFPGFYGPLPPQTRVSILEKAKAEGVVGTGEDLFLHVRYSPAVLQDAQLLARLSGFLNQYGFNRNLSFTALLGGSGMLLAWKVVPGADPELWKYGTTILAAGVLLLYRFLKFFRQYSYELFNAYGRVR